MFVIRRPIFPYRSNLRSFYQISSQIISHPSEQFRYNKAIDHLQSFQKILGENSVISDEFDMDKYRYDWKRNYYGGSLVCIPSTKEQIIDIMKYCSKHQVGVVVQGGNTGLVGGGVGTKRGELILSMEKLNKIIHIDTQSATVTCEAGCILETLNTAVSTFGLMIPLDLGPKGSCQIGGNISTNAGGLRVVKYGSLQANVLGLEIITAQGEIIDMLRTLYKDNTGYHLRHLFIGAEGTLGIVTKIVLRLVPLPSFTTVVFNKLIHFHQIATMFTLTRNILGGNLSAFEFMDCRSIHAVRIQKNHLLQRVASTVIPHDNNGTEDDNNKDDASFTTILETKNDYPNGIPGEIAVLVEVSGTDPETDQMKLEKYVQHLMEKEIVVDAILSTDMSQTQALWLIREQVPVALMDRTRQAIVYADPTATTSSRYLIEIGSLFKYDISMTLSDMNDVIYASQLQCAQQFGFQVFPLQPQQTRKNKQSSSSSSLSTDATSLEFCCYGHAGDQNLHLNIYSRTLCWIDRENIIEAIHKAQQSSSCSNSNGHPTTAKRWQIPVTSSILHASQVINPIGSTSIPEEKSKEMNVLDYHHILHHLIDGILYPLVIKHRGSISAEHGIGQEKIAALYQARSPNELLIMQQVKQVLDPKYILNPGKMFY
jgi:FAD/FMN-containing dehydrogenase